MTQPWPWPHDTALARARRVARSYRDALNEVDPQQCRELDQRMRQYGQRWVAPTPAVYGDDDYLAAEHVADYAAVSVATVYTWRGRGLPSMRTNEGIRFRFADVTAWLGGQRASN